MWSKKFWILSAERMIKSAAQAVILAWFGGDIVFDVFNMDWQVGVGAAIGGAFLSLLTSIATAPMGPNGDPSAIDPDA